MATTPKLVMTLWDLGILQPDLLLNDALRMLDMLLGGHIISRTTDAEPGAPTEGDAYIITGSATGTNWATYTANDLAVFSGASWISYTPDGRMSVRVSDEADLVVFWDGSIWSTAEVAVTTLFTAGSAAGAVAQAFGDDSTEGYEIKVVDEILSGLSAVSTDLTADIPDGAYILSVQGNIETAVVAGGTSVKVGIGPVADPDKYGITSAFTQNLKIDTIPIHAILSGAEDVQVNMCATGGGIGDTVASAGAVRVRIVYALPNSLVDA